MPPVFESVPDMLNPAGGPAFAVMRGSWGGAEPFVAFLSKGRDSSKSPHLVISATCYGCFIDSKSLSTQ